jgi:hypothetical protein
VKRALLIITILLVVIGGLTYLTLSQASHRVEVCLEFQGKQNCASAAGSSQQQAIRTATDLACATISSGVTDTMACSNTKPTSIRSLNGK